MAIEFKRIQLKQDTESNLKTENEILLSGEPAFELDRIRMKIGDGSTPYEDLPYIGAEEFIVFTTLEDLNTYDYTYGNTYYYWNTGDFPANNPFSAKLDKAGFLWTLKNVDIDSTRQLAFHRGSNEVLMRQRTTIEDWTDWQLVFTSETEDAIKEQHIDWGIGAEQVSAVDLPVEDPENKFVGDNVEDILAEIAFPVGSMMMFDANNPGGASGGASGAWQDNVSMPGWYACIPENSARGCPNMVDKFVMGKAVAGAGGTGGANSTTLSIAQLPSHDHSANHNHTASSGTQSANHTHVVNGGSHTHTINRVGTAPVGSYDGLEVARRNRLVESGFVNADGGHTHTVGSNSASHNHSITVDTKTFNTGSTGSGSSIDNRPSFYSLIFIRKCA